MDRERTGCVRIVVTLFFLLQDPSNPTFREKMKEFMQKFDKNKDGRIEMSEVICSNLKRRFWTQCDFTFLMRSLLSRSFTVIGLTPA